MLRSIKKSSKKKRKSRRFFPFRRTLGILFLTLGLIFLFFVPAVPVETREAEPIVAGKFSENKKGSQIVKILIPNIDIDLSVKSSKIVNGYWETSDIYGSHGEGSANPGENNNIVVFAHAREGLFYNLKNIKEDDVIYIFTKDRWFLYKVSEIQTVYPNETKTVSPANREVLTLFTCSGFFDEKRLIVKAYPVRGV